MPYHLCSHGHPTSTGGSPQCPKTGPTFWRLSRRSTTTLADATAAVVGMDCGSSAWMFLPVGSTFGFLRAPTLRLSDVVCAEARQQSGPGKSQARRGRPRSGLGVDSRQQPCAWLDCSFRKEGHTGWGRRLAPALRSRQPDPVTQVRLVRSGSGRPVNESPTARGARAPQKLQHTDRHLPLIGTTRSSVTAPISRIGSCAASAKQRRGNEASAFRV